MKDTKVFNASDIDDMMVDEVAFLKEFAQAIHVNYNIVDSYLNGAGNSDDDEKKRIIFDTKLKKTFYQNDRLQASGGALHELEKKLALVETLRKINKLELRGVDIV